MTILMCFMILNCVAASALQYSAPDDCDWTQISSNDVSLSCNLQTIVASGVLATNFSLIQSDHTVAMSVTCESLFFESSLAPASFSHLRNLKALQFKQCKIKEVPRDAFSGLTELKNLSIRTMNDEWGEFSLSIHPESFNELHQLETLDLGHNKLQKFTDRTFCHLSSLKTLNLTQNELTSVISHVDGVSKVYEFCVNDLSELDLSHNKIMQVEANDLKYFKSLRLLRLAHNYIASLDCNILKDFSKLQVIDMSYNHLSTLPAMLFEDSPDIREMNLQNNSINHLPQGLLNGLQQLVILNFSFNKISSDSIRPETFVDLIRLVILDLSHNELNNINNTLFQSQYSLQMLFLSHNNIDTIADNSFSSLYNLHTLDLSHNRMKYLDIFTLNGLYVISNLKLSYNSIYGINPDAFKNCSSVQDLTLKGNNLSFIPTALTSLQFLKTLDLSNNSIQGLYNASFRELKQLRHLSLSMNIIGNLTRGTFKHMVGLKELDLSKNKIQNLEHGIFDDIESVSKIDLSDNQLLDINGLFMNLKGLVSLNVSRNMIFWFDYAVVPAELEELDLHSNGIETLGNYYELEATLQLRSLDVSHNLIMGINAASFPNGIQFLKINDNRISNVYPFTFTAKGNISFVNMSNNFIETLDINTFRLNPNALKKPFPKFAISGNPFFCDCNMEWLQHMNKPDATLQYPHIVDLEKVMCQLSFTRHAAFLPLSKSKSSDFLCKYRSHCFALCHCCEFDACDCEMVCPDNCTCYADQTWNTNIVDCSSQNFSSMPSVIPMDVTDLYLDGNNIYQLTSHTFIGRKNMRIIFLNNSNIHVINNRTFNGLLTLRILHLENNQLVSLNGYEFETLIHLEELYLSSNKIRFVANTTFQNLKSLTHLHLDHNLIMDYQVWNLKLNTRLTSLQLGHNPWNCNCQYLESYYEWLQSSSSLIKDIASVQCRYNQSAGPYLVEFNVASCSNYTAITYFQAVFQADYMPIIIIVPIVILILLLLTILICVYRKEIKVWLYTKYGIRLFERNTFPPETEKLFDAFISYSKKDENFISQFLAPELEYGTPSYRLCLRYRDLPMSGYVAEAITEAIECSHRTIIVLSEQFLKSEWCRFELKSAHRESQCNRKHKLVVVIMDKLSIKDVDPDARMCFRSAPVIRWGDKRFWEKLKYAMPNGQGQQKPDPKIKFSQRLPNSNSIKLV
ncbi:toll-like receptor Tollo [Uloborus diversus]|uniref:toll-like receptor Tollo n=1 Tax=Uloborus diversus TaxID=327109 RepID=UPI002409DF92|nr:toll-like receptor Tollo [Uloborus diversus]XP_054709477.1 toll-like receptor Tollo [Uloborus diversus]